MTAETQTHTSWPAPRKKTPSFCPSKAWTSGLVGSSTKRVGRRALLFLAFFLASGLFRAGRARELEVRASSGYLDRWDFLLRTGMAGAWPLCWLELWVLSQAKPVMPLVSVNVTVPSSRALSCPLSGRMLLWLESSLPSPMR